MKMKFHSENRDTCLPIWTFFFNIDLIGTAYKMNIAFNESPVFLN